MQKLQSHYGGLTREAQINASKAKIDNLHYCGERYLPFKEFATKLNGAQ
jgi:hypothetical protein